MGTDPARLSLSLPQHTVYRSVSKWVMPQYMAIKNGEIVFQASINRGIVGYFKVMFFIFQTLGDFFWSRFWWCSKPIQTMGLSASPNIPQPLPARVNRSSAELWSDFMAASMQGGWSIWMSLRRAFLTKYPSVSSRSCGEIMAKRGFQPWNFGLAQF